MEKIIRKINNLLENSNITRIDVRRHNKEILLFRYEIVEDEFELPHEINRGARNLRGEIPENEWITPEECEPLTNQEFLNALDVIEKYDAEMAEYENQQQALIEEELAEMEHKISEREKNRSENDNTVYADEAWAEQIVNNAYEHINYLL